MPSHRLLAETEHQVCSFMYRSAHRLLAETEHQESTRLGPIDRLSPIPVLGSNRRALPPAHNSPPVLSYPMPLLARSGLEYIGISYEVRVTFAWGVGV